jgi:hypothetical protein
MKLHIYGWLIFISVEIAITQIWIHPALGTGHTMISDRRKNLKAQPEN